MYIKLDSPMTIIKINYFNRLPVTCLGYSGLKYHDPMECKQSMEFSMTEHWSGQPLPSPGDLPNPGIKPRSPTLHTDSLPAEPQGSLK